LEDCLFVSYLFLISFLISLLITQSSNC
jgi:hypothetical protein